MNCHQNQKLQKLRNREEFKVFRLARIQTFLPLLFGQSDGLPATMSLVEKGHVERPSQIDCITEELILT